MGAVSGTGQYHLKLSTAWRGHNCEPGIAARGISRVLLLFCNVLVHLRIMETPYGVTITSPLVKWRSGLKACLFGGSKFEILKKP